MTQKIYIFVYHSKALRLCINHWKKCCWPLSLSQ